MEIVAATRALAYVVVAVGSTVLLWYLHAYVRSVLAGPTGGRWWYLGVGIAAGVVYGVAGLVDVLTPFEWPGTFATGATLFFILFLALGIRSLYRRGIDSGTGGARLPEWVDTVVIAGFVAAWWAGFLVTHAWTPVVVGIGWVGASAWALYYAVLTVGKHEGTSFAAITRHLLPAIVSVSVVVVADLLSRSLGDFAAVAEALWIVGTVLVGAFLFTTAVAIRQQGGEVSRMYDWTTWRAGRPTSGTERGGPE